MSTDEPDIYDAVAELRDKERLKEVRENRRVWHGGMGQTTRDIDFLLSYVDELESKHTALREQLAEVFETLKSLKNCRNKPVCGHCNALLRAAVKE